MLLIAIMFDWETINDLYSVVYAFLYSRDYQPESHITLCKFFFYVTSISVLR